MAYANPDAVTSIGVSTFAYDNAGNETTGGSSTFTWDWRGRLNTSHIAATSSTYSCDENDKRMLVNDGLSIFYYPNDLYQADSLSGVPTKHIQLNGRDMAVLTGATGSSSIKYSFPDNQNSTNVVTYSTSGILQALDYYPYGSARINSGTDVSQRKYIGQFTDPTNIDYLNARYYDSGRGQFLSQDQVFLGNPKQQLLNDPQSLNSYSYSVDNPTTKGDPNGRTALTGGFDFSAWNFTGNAGLSFDRYGVDYYYGWGLAAGVHAGGNAGVTTDNLSHSYSLTSSGFAAMGDVYGGEVSYGMTEYPYTKKPSQESMVMTGGINFGDAVGERTVVSGPLLVWGSRPQTTLPTIYQVRAQNASISAPGNTWSLPSTVSVGGTTFYRNYSGLLSSTMSQSTAPVIGNSLNKATNSVNSGSGGNPFPIQYHAIVPL